MVVIIAKRIENRKNKNPIDSNKKKNSIHSGEWEERNCPNQ